ncbi:chemotaxis protein CheD [Aurantiacibacter poecillastricola]|uniref:chemotaxis protein CheD n=1 Tax=Aurantiacibacter poecillastricola TaxID=3064385 RepID=UPI0027401A7B|nr:chemotaxis protein CheD [Aurantiacibacter sp. 219JJ12-13]MDP5262384.1 chemotaxis protein CheD [Aurantiacibacter sp. 219JJ12-13]
MAALDPPPSHSAPDRVTVMQGEARASAEPTVEFSTVLGSCVAMCLFDPSARVGGMNHFLLAEPPTHRSREQFDEHYGLFLMELLVNEMLALGASKSRLKARLYGGANIHRGLSPIGTANADFARRFVVQEGIELTQADLGGNQARRVHFLPASGRVRCRLTAAQATPTQQPLRRPQSALGDVELF